MSKKHLSKDFTQGSIWRFLITMSIPFMAANALQVLYSIIDMVIVGKIVGTAGLSAVYQSSLILNFATMMCLGFSNAGQILVAHAIGSQKRKELNQIIGTLFSLISAMGIVLSVVILFARTWILDVMNMPTESYAMSMDYLIICGCGLFFTAGYNMVSAVLRGMGDSKRPLLFIGIATVVNLVLDIIFTGFLDMKVAGAAWATIIGQGVSFLFSLYYLFKHREAFGFDFKLSSFIPKFNYVRLIFNQGLPMAIQAGCINISMMFVNSLVNSISVVASATFGVGVRIDDIFSKISQGIQFAAMPIVAQNIAAGKNDRAKKTVYYSWIFAGALTVICMTIYLTMGKQLFMMFSDDPLVHEMSHTFIQAILWMMPALTIMRGTFAFIQGIGNAYLGLVLAMLDGVVLRIGLSWLFGIALGWGFYGFVLGYALATYGTAIPSCIYFLSGKWEKRKVLADQL